MRYLLFAGYSFYARGGIKDLKDTSGELADLIAVTEAREEYAEWWHIFDVQSRRVVKSFGEAHDVDYDDTFGRWE